MPLHRKGMPEVSPTIYLADDEGIKKYKIPKQDFGRFTAIGEIDSMQTSHKGPLKTDIFNQIENISKSAFILFNTLKKRRDPATNMCVYSLDHPTRSQQVGFNKSLAELKAQGIVIKAKTTNIVKPVPKHCYMINPHLLKAFEKEEAEAIWHVLTEGKLQLPANIAEFVPYDNK